MKWNVLNSHSAFEITPCTSFSFLLDLQRYKGSHVEFNKIHAFPLLIVKMFLPKSHSEAHSVLWRLIKNICEYGNLCETVLLWVSIKWDLLGAGRGEQARSCMWPRTGHDLAEEEPACNTWAGDRDMSCRRSSGRLTRAGGQVKSGCGSLCKIQTIQNGHLRHSSGRIWRPKAELKWGLGPSAAWGKPWGRLVQDSQG